MASVVPGVPLWLALLLILNPFASPTPLLGFCPFSKNWIRGDKIQEF